MRHLLQPRILQTAALAAVVSTAACIPRLCLWPQRPAPLWYLIAVILVCCIPLWAFVFAWHGPYTGRPVIILKQEPAPLLVATLGGLVMAALNLWLDPQLRPKFPTDYPPDVAHWAATVAFTLGLNLLFLVFAPFDWLLRLLKRRWLAAVIVGLWAAGLMLMKVHALHVGLAPWLLAWLLVARLAAGLLLVWFYLRGGVLLVAWWTFLLESRHLLGLHAG